MGRNIKSFIRTILLAPIITAITYLLAIMPRMFNRPSFDEFKGHFYAHRGLHDNDTDAPENSLPAFQKAVDAGYGIELDVQLTKDGLPVVFHDFDLKRICGIDKKIKDCTYKQLQELTLLHTDCKIPLFTEVLNIVDGKVPLIIEYKLPSFHTGVCVEVDRILEDYKGLYCIESFHPMALHWYKKNRPDVVRGILSTDYFAAGEIGYSAFTFTISKYMLGNWFAKPDFIAYDIRYFTNTSRQICKKIYKAPSVAWTAKSQEEMEARTNDFDIFIFEGYLPK